MSEKVSMQDIIDLLAEERKITKQEAEIFIKTLFDLIEEALENDQYIKIKGLGCFKLIRISSRESIHVNTGERILIQGHTKISFTPDPSLRDLINKPFAHFETVILNDETNLDDTPVEEYSDEETDQEDSLVNEYEVTQEVNNIIAETPAPKDSLPEVPEKTTVKEVLAVTQPKKDKITSNDPNPKDKQGLPYFIAVVVIVITMLSGIIIYNHNPQLLLDMLPETEQETVTKPDSILNPKPEIPVAVVQARDSLKDTLSVTDKTKEIPSNKVLKEVSKEKMKQKTASPEPVRPDSMNYRITGTKATYTLQPGETLIMVSKRFYGTKDLWPYIAKHNSDIINNPDKVPLGITIRVPELRKK